MGSRIVGFTALKFFRCFLGFWELGFWDGARLGQHNADCREEKAQVRDVVEDIISRTVAVTHLLQTASRALSRQIPPVPFSRPMGLFHQRHDDGVFDDIPYLFRALSCTTRRTIQSPSTPSHRSPAFACIPDAQDVLRSKFPYAVKGFRV